MNAFTQIVSKGEDGSVPNANETEDQQVEWKQQAVQVESGCFLLSSVQKQEEISWIWGSKRYGPRWKMR